MSVIKHSDAYSGAFTSQDMFVALITIPLKWYFEKTESYNIKFVLFCQNTSSDSQTSNKSYCCLTLCNVGKRTNKGKLSTFIINHLI